MIYHHSKGYKHGPRHVVILPEEDYPHLIDFQPANLHFPKGELEEWLYEHKAGNDTDTDVTWWNAPHTGGVTVAFRDANLMVAFKLRFG